jgi:molecular chaperone GrpE (heat shock protein)
MRRNKSSSPTTAPLRLEEITAEPTFKLEIDDGAKMNKEPIPENKDRDKLKYSESRLSEVEVVCEELRKQIAPLQEKLDRLTKDADYHRSRVAKYRNRLATSGE